MAIYFLGGGNMATAIIAGLRAQSADETIIVADKNPEKQTILQQKYHIQTTFRLPETLTANDTLILAVKPQDMQTALHDVRVGEALVLSVAAGLTVATLAQWTGSQRIIRIMPNTPAAVGLGVSGLFAATGASEADKATATRLMSTCGSVVWLNDEAQMHAITAISGSGSAYVFYFMNALQTAAQQLGFSDAQARDLAVQTFQGAVALAMQSDETLSTLQQNVTSKGGTTFAALSTFEQWHIAKHIQAGVAAAAARSEEMAAAI